MRRKREKKEVMMYFPRFRGPPVKVVVLDGLQLNSRG
jgi:hypothetical protein